MPRCDSLPYFHDSALLFERLADLPWALFLDSGRPAGTLGRFDILSAEPFVTLVTREGVTTVTTAEACWDSQEDPFQLLREQLSPWQEPVGELPFYGGAMGYFSYDLARLLESLPGWAAEKEPLPQMAMGIYDWAVVVDHQLQQSWLVSAGRDLKTAQIWPQLLAWFENPEEEKQRCAFRVESELSASETACSYRQAVARIHDYIRAGDCYQVNFAQRFDVEVRGDSWQGYCSLRHSNPAPYGAYFSTPFATLLSSSPECFLQHKQGRVVTLPIKGTRPRFDAYEVDQQSADDLRNSVKDRAENVMIVDLLRNDLSKHARLASV
ncbi:MAG: chorismate-binding protein, partial [Gammaproteobacteria bacterium]|nr:chorismate-binding protein [Gammaproteobacteria bacterium]